MIPALPSLAKATGQKHNWLISTSSGTFDREILNGQCDFALSLYAPLDPSIASKRVAKENWVVIAPR